MAFDPAVEQWRGLLMQLGPGIPTDYGLAWMTKESGGLACATGACGLSNNQATCCYMNVLGRCSPRPLTQLNPNATYIKEAGLFQIYFETPGSISNGFSLSQLRAPCSGFSQNATRQLTDDEKYVQVMSGVNLINESINKTQAQVDPSITQDNPDFWKFVKFQHNLPGHLVNYVNQYGPIQSWEAFATWEKATGGNNGVSAVANAQWTAAYFTPQGYPPLVDNPIAEFENDVVNNDLVSASLTTTEIILIGGAALLAFFGAKRYSAFLKTGKWWGS